MSGTFKSRKASPKPFEWRQVLSLSLLALLENDTLHGVGWPLLPCCTFAMLEHTPQDGEPTTNSCHFDDGPVPLLGQAGSWDRPTVLVR